MPTSRFSRFTVATVAHKNKGGGTCRATSMAEVTFLKLMAELEPELREAVRCAFFEPPERFEAFAAAPASLNGHHNIPGGNLRHTVDVAQKALALAGDSRHVDRHVLLAACLLHDIGKCEEYVETAGGTRMSESGSLLGHKVSGLLISAQALQPLMAKSKLRVLTVLNAIACTSRSYDYRGPMTLEAHILSKADQLSATSDLFEQSWRASGNRFHGKRHPHLAEPPKHPCALPGAPAYAAPALQKVETLPRWKRWPAD